MDAEGNEIKKSVSGISLITKGGRPKPPDINEKIQENHNNEFIGEQNEEPLNTKTELIEIQKDNENNNIKDIDIEKENDVDVDGKENNEYYTESDLLANENDKLSELYKAMPSRIYLEKTNVISVVTLALQSVTEERPKDAVEFVANFLLKYNQTYKIKQKNNTNEGNESNVNEGI